MSQDDFGFLLCSYACWNTEKYQIKFPSIAYVSFKQIVWKLYPRPWTINDGPSLILDLNTFLLLELGLMICPIIPFFRYPLNKLSSQSTHHLKFIKQCFFTTSQVQIWLLYPSQQSVICLQTRSCLVLNYLFMTQCLHIW